jgi:hypothetical protein
MLWVPAGWPDLAQPLEITTMSYDDRNRVFRDPGGKSALRAASASNPRNLPCPTCKQPDRLTPVDVRRGYQCDDCADREEG